MSYNVIFEDLGVKDYGETWTYQNEIFNKLVKRKFDISNGVIQDTEEVPGTLIFVEHPHVYTIGKSGKDANLLISKEQLEKIDAQLYHIDRGGDITYHGPGQIVGYPIFDLEKLHIGIKEYIYRIEEAIILSLKEIGIEASRYSGGTGVWLDVDVPSKTRKICAIGVRSSRYVTMHGFALNVNTDLSYFNYINPCGFTDKGVTSIAKEKEKIQDFEKIKEIIRDNLSKVFNLNLILN